MQKSRVLLLLCRHANECLAPNPLHCPTHAPSSSSSSSSSKLHRFWWHKVACGQPRRGLGQEDFNRRLREAKKARLQFVVGALREAGILISRDEGKFMILGTCTEFDRTLTTHPSKLKIGPPRQGSQKGRTTNFPDRSVHVLVGGRGRCKCVPFSTAEEAAAAWLKAKGDKWQEILQMFN